MLNFKTLSILIIINIFSHQLGATEIQEDSYKPRSYNSAIRQEADSSPSLISNVWNKLATAFSSLLSKTHPSSTKIQEPSNISWHTIMKSHHSPGWQQQGSKVLYHVAELSYDNLNDFFLYLNTKLSNPLTADEFKKHLNPHHKLILSNFKKIQEIEVNDKNLPQFIESYIEFYSTLNKGTLPSLIKKDCASSRYFFDEESQFEEFNLFRQGLLLSKCLKEISSYECRQENLPLLNMAVKRLYRKLDGGRLQEDSIKVLRRLGVNIDLPRNINWSRTATGITFLLLLGSANILTPVAAQRPQLLEEACNGSYKECESAFALLNCCGYEDGIDPILNFNNFDGYLQFALTNPIRRFALGDPLQGLMPNLKSAGYYSEINSFRIGTLPLSDLSLEFYNLYGPGIGHNRTQINGTSYQDTSYYIYDVRNIQPNISIIDTSTQQGSLSFSYLDQLPNSEFLLLIVMNNDNTFGIGNAVLKPSNGPSSLLWQRLITNQTVANRVNSSKISTTPLNAIKPSTASERDNRSFANFLSSFYSGYVDNPSGQNSRSIQQFAEDNNLIPSNMINCLQRLGLDPLVCSSYLPSASYARLTYYFVEKYAGLYTVTTNVIDGPVVENIINHQLNSTTMQQLTHSYQWNPTLQEPNTTHTVTLNSINSLRSNLTEGTVEKFAELYLPNSTAAIILRVSQSSSGSPVNYYAILGPEIIAATAPTPSPTPGGNNGSPSSSSNDATVIGAAVGGAVGGTVLLAGGTTLAVVLGLKYRHDKKKKAFDNADDMELGELPPATPAVAADAFTAKGEGVEAGRIIIKGAMHGHEYVLLPDVDRREAKELKVLAGLNIDFEEDEDEKKVTLGAGNFGRVFPARLRGTRQYDAMKVVVGTENVKASRREGKLQESLGQKEGVLPLLEYLHFKPTSDNRRDIKQLLNATFGSTTIRGQDMTQQELLLQVTPLAALGNGWTFQDKLALLPNNKLKDQLLTHFALSLLTGLKNMHDDGISHLDVKPTNVLVHTDGTVYVSDFGCALQKDNIKGGLGDIGYASPERIAHLRFAMISKGYEFESTEMASYFSGKAADAFAAGITLLEIANNEYPFGFEKNVIEMLNKRDSDYFEEYFEDAYEKIEKNFKNLTILPVLKGLLESKPKKRFTTLKAQEELLKLKPKSSPKELFADFMKALSEKETQPAKKEAVNTNVAPASSFATTSYAYEDKLPSQQAYKQEVPSEYVDKLPSPSNYGEEFPSLYKDLQKEYEDTETELNSSNDSVEAPYAEPHNDNIEDTRYTVPNLKPYDNDNHPSATYEEPDLNTRDDSRSMYFTPKFKP